MRFLAIWIDQRQSFKIAGENVISQLKKDILNQKHFSESGLEESDAKTFKSYFLETIFMSKLRDTRSSNSGSFSSTDLKFGSFIPK